MFTFVESGFKNLLHFKQAFVNLKKQCRPSLFRRLKQKHVLIFTLKLAVQKSLSKLMLFLEDTITFIYLKAMI